MSRPGQPWNDYALLGAFVLFIAAICVWLWNLGW